LTKRKLKNLYIDKDDRALKYQDLLAVIPEEE